MIIEKIILENWQPYQGKVAEKTETIFDVSDVKNKKSAIIYGENGFGKSGFWESISWALYGRVMIGKNEKKLIETNFDNPDSKKTLINHNAVREKDLNVSVTIEFDHDGIKYRLTRRASPRTGVKSVERDSQMKITFDIYKIEEFTLVENPQEFINKIIPEGLARFFMFDGEHLEHYRDLMEKQHKTELIHSIEAILRLDCLTEGISECKRIGKNTNSDITKFESAAIKDQNIKKRVKELMHVVEKDKTERDGHLNELAGMQSEFETIKNWLNQFDKLKIAHETIERCNKRIAEINDTELPTKYAERSACFNNSWKIFIQDNVKASISSTNDIMERQKGQESQIQVLKDKIKIAEEAIEGDNCSHCGSELEKLSAEEIDIKYEEIEEHKNGIKKLMGKSQSPNPTILYEKMIKLNVLHTDKDLANVNIFTKQIRELQRELRDLERDKKTALEMAAPEKRRQVKAKITRRNNLIELMGLCNGQINFLEESIEEGEAAVASIVGGGLAEDEKSLAYQKAEIKKELIEELEVFLTEILSPYREAMRQQVEEYTSKVFMDCTNKKAEYDGIKIKDDFTISIKTKTGKFDEGGAGKGQWSLIAYSLLDALTKCSEIEFPFIIDTPGRSLGSENLDRVFNHLFFSADRQIILLPNEGELHPNKGNKNYGPYTAKTYIIQRNFDKENSKLIQMTKEGVKVE